MKSKNKLIILGLLMAVFLGLPSINAFAAAIKWDGGAGTTNWNDANNWDGNVVPTSSDDVTLDNSLVVAAYTVNVNTAADVNSLTIHETAGVTLRPDASSARTMRVRDNLVLTAGSILYTNAGTTGRLSWTFDGSGATNSINNVTDDEAKMQFFNLTIDGSITTVAGDNNGDMEIYGNLTINGSFLPSTNADDSHVYFKGSGKTITNNGSLELNTVTYNNNSSYTTNTDLTVNGDMNVASGSSLILQNPSIVTLANNPTKTLTNAGTLTFQAGSSLNVNANTTLVGDLANFAGDLTVGAATLKVTASNEIAGTGSITTGATSVINVNDGDGVAGAIDLGTYSFNAATDYIIEGGITGFAGASITAAKDITFGTATGSALAITINDSFTMTGDLTVIGNATNTTVTATSGTITMTGTKAITTSGETLDFYGLLIDGGTVTVADGEGIIINNYLGVATGAVLDFVNTGGIYDAITVDGTATILIDDIATGLLVDDNAEIELTGNVTFADGLTLANQATAGGINIGASAVVDLAGFTITTAGAGNVTTASGATLKTSHEDGIAGNFTSTAANVFHDATNYEFNTNAKSFGFFNFDGTGNITDAANITINGALIDETGAATDVDVTLTGDLTVTTGSMILPDQATGIIIMNTTGSDLNITNSTGSQTNLVFNELQLDGTNNVVVLGDFSVVGTNGPGLEMNAAATLDCTTNDAAVYITGATTDIMNTGNGTYNFHNLVIEGTGVTINTNVTTGFNIEGNLEFGAVGAITAADNSIVSFTGTGTQTISNLGVGAVSLNGIIVGSNSNVVNTTNITLGNNDELIDIDGTFASSSSLTTVTVGNAGVNLDVDGSATFYHLLANAGTNADGSVFILDLLSGDEYTQTTGNLTFLGNPNDLDATAITNDSKQIANATVTTLTVTSTLVVDSNCELQRALAIAGGGNVRVDGRLELTATAATSAPTIDLTDDTYGDGGTLHLSGANTNGLDDVGTISTDENSDIILTSSDNAFTDIGFGTRTVRNITFDHTGTGPIALAADLITIHGNIIQDGVDFGDSDDDSRFTFAGTTTQTVSGTGDISVGEIIVNAGADVDVTADIILEDADGQVIAVASTGSYVASAGNTTFDAQTSGTNIVNSNADGSGLEFHDVTIAAAATAVGFNTPFTINGSLTHVSGGGLVDAGAGEVTFSGSGETITVGASNELQFNDLTFTGSYGLAGDFAIDIAGDLEITNTGSFDMNSVGELEFTTAGSNIINDGNLTVNDLEINGNDLTTADNFTVEGNFLNNAGTFVSTGTSLITFDGITANNPTLTGTGTASETQFVSVTVDGELGLSDDITLTGNLIVNGTFVADNGSADEVAFTGTTTKTIQNAGTLTFGSLTVNDIANNIVNTANSFSIGGDFTVGGPTNGGRFIATAGTVSLNGGAGQTVNNDTEVGTNLKFFNLTLTNTGTEVRFDEDFYINGDLTLEDDAIFDAQFTADVRVFFNGSDQQDINLEGNGTLGAGNSTSLLISHATVNNADGLRLVGTGNDIIEGQLEVDATLRLQTGDIDLNGNNIITINLTAGGSKEGNGKLDETAGNTVVNNGPSTSTGHVYATQTPGTSLSNINFGGLGAIITSGDPGTLTVKRYHIPLTVGNQTQASRYYSIDGSTTTGLDAKLVFKYDASELGVLTEDDLILVHGDDPAVDVWTIQESTLNTDLRRLTTPNSAIDGFTGQTEWWTIGTPDVLTATSITNGLATTPISAGTNDNAIFGVQYTSNGSVDLSSVRFNLGRNLGATNEVAKWKLVYSEDDDFSTTEDNYTMIDVAPGGANTTGGTSGLSYVTFDVSGQDAAYNVVNEGTPINYFLVTDVVSTVTAATSTITPSTNNLITTISEGITQEFSLTGSAYAFRASIMVSPHEVGLTDAPLIAGQSDVVLFGYKASVTSAAGLPGITGFSLSFDEDPSAVFENVRVYSSVSEHDFADMAAGDLISLASSNVTSTEFDITFSAKRVLATTPTYFFVVADVKDGVRNTSPDITPTLTYANLESSDAGIRGTDINGNAASSHNGFVYSFVNSTVTVDVSNNTAASNLGTRVDRQPIFGFTLTPDNNQPVSFTGANLTVTLSAAALANNLSNWSLYYDANGNGFGETSEKIANGTLTSTSGVGNLTFTGFTQSLSSARKYLVGVKVGSGATAGSTVKVQLTSTDYITLASPAKLNATGPLPATAVTHTIRTAGTATALTLVHYNTSVTTGNTLGFTVRAVDANGYPTVVSAAETVTIAPVSGTGTVGGTTTGTIANGTNNVIVSPSFTAATGSTDKVVKANGSSLTSSANSNAITILEAEPAANDAIVTIANITATTARITNITANSGSTDGRIVVIRQGSAPHVPTDATAYTASLDLASAGAVGTGQTGAGSYVVMANVAAGAAAYSNDITGLMPNTRYYVQVFDYNGTTPNFNYATGTAFTSESVRNPISFTTSSGDISSASTETLPANIQTDIDITSTISAADEIDWYQFKIPSTKNNAIIRLSNLPANYEVELYDASAGIINKTLLRDSKVTLQGDEVIILNGAAAGPYVIKVYGANGDAYSTSSYTLRVSTSNNEIFSQVE